MRKTSLDEQKPHWSKLKWKLEFFLFEFDLNLVLTLLRDSLLDDFTSHLISLVELNGVQVLDVDVDVDDA